MTITMSLPAVQVEHSLFVERLYLTGHVFLARAGCHYVFLDLRQDSYICVDPQFTAYLDFRLDLPPADVAWAVKIDPAVPAAAEDLLAQMIELGILTSDPRNGKKATQLTHVEGIRELPRYGVGGPRIRFGHVAAFLKAAAVAKMLLRLGRIEATVMRITNRRIRSASPAPQYSEEVRDLVEIFRKLRPLTMRRKDRCLLNSLALIEFLAAFNVFPAWYFGVRMNEFLAHCWVQEGPTIYDDDVENICDYSIIMRA
jgi:hypothetical protein